MTKTGNTRDAAEQLSGVLQELSPSADITLQEIDKNITNSTNHIRDSNADAYVFGAPVHSWRLPKRMKKFISSIPNDTINDKNVMTFNTEGGIRGFMPKKMRKLLKGKGGVLTNHTELKYGRRNVDKDGACGWIDMSWDLADSAKELIEGVRRKKDLQ